MAPRSNSQRALAREVAKKVDELNEQRDTISFQISGQYDRLRDAGITVKNFKKVMLRRGKPREEVEASDAEIRKYEEWLSGLPAPSGTIDATRGRAHEDDEDEEADDE